MKGETKLRKYRVMNPLYMRLAHLEAETARQAALDAYHWVCNNRVFDGRKPVDFVDFAKDTVIIDYYAEIAHARRYGSASFDTIPGLVDRSEWSYPEDMG